MGPNAPSWLTAMPTLNCHTPIVIDKKNFESYQPYINSETALVV